MVLIGFRLKYQILLTKSLKSSLNRFFVNGDLFMYPYQFWSYFRCILSFVEFLRLEIVRISSNLKLLETIGRRCDLYPWNHFVDNLAIMSRNFVPFEVKPIRDYYCIVYVPVLKWQLVCFRYRGTVYISQKSIFHCMNPICPGGNIGNFLVIES